MNVATVVGIAAASLLALLSILMDNPIVLFTSAIVLGLSTYNLSLVLRLVSFVVFLILWFLLMIIHTALFNSNAVMGLFALVFFSPILLAIQLIVSFLAVRLVKK